MACYEILITIGCLVFFAAAVPAQISIRAFDDKISLPDGCQYLAENKDRHKDDKYFFCPEKPEEYPHEKVDSHVQALQKLVSSETVEDYSDQPDDEYVRDPSCWKEKHKNCCTESKREQPYFVNSENKMKLVIQSKYFQQTILATKCAYENEESCFEDLKLQDFGYKTKCVTNYGTTKLLVYNGDTDEVETVPATFPVSCSCVISKD